MSDENKDSFLLLNRDFDYLKSSAVSFARLHKLEQAVEKMYEADEWVAFARFKRKRKPKRVSRARSSSRTGARISAVHDDTEFKIRKLSKRARREPIFAWPIEKRNFWLSSFFWTTQKN